MHILLTGASGQVGSHTLLYLLKRNHKITALDLVPLPPAVLSLLQTLSAEQQANFTFHQCDLTDYRAFETILDEAKPESVVHLGAVPNPNTLDYRDVHNINVTSSYNVLRTCATRGIRRIVQASSVNATGLSYTPGDHQRFRQMPVTESHPILPEDPYAISKAVCELQADALTRYHPDLRIASLRFHMVKDDYKSAMVNCNWKDGFAWTSFDAAASSCLRAILSDGWEGHEAFIIAAPEICWEGGLTADSKSPEVLSEKRGAVELMQSMWDGRVEGWNMAYWEGNPRRSTFDSSKAERMLGWDHDQAAEMDL